MYGLLIESLAEYLRATYGEDTWETIRRNASVETSSFSTQGVYPEPLLPRLVVEAGKVLNVTENELMESVGIFFVVFVGRYGYDRVLSVLGRHLRDFLNGLDNLHEYLRFSYPRMRPPSFFCEDENRNGLTLHYRTRRKGYLYYTMGQIKAVGEHYYHTPVRIDIVSEETQISNLHVVFKLHFDNTGYDEENDKIVVLLDEKFLPIQAHVMFEIFPFCIVFDKKLEILVLGTSLQNITPHFVGKKVSDVFSIVRPLVDLAWSSILSRTNNIFELTTLEPIHPPVAGEENVANVREILSDEGFGNDQEPTNERSLQLKGQMMIIEDWQCIIYLGTPVMSDIDTMLATGLYINDLSMHDFSRDLLLAGTQQSVELKLALDQEQQKTKRLEESMKKLDEEMKRTDELLYQMIPKAVADRLRKGECAVSTCEMFNSVTILFSDVVTFTEMCSRITPMEVVSLLNCMYSLFDNLTEKHKVYKVETIGDAYMTVGGAPDRVDDHAGRVCDMALDMLQVIGGLRDPSTNDSIRIRVGINSGSVVAGVVGVKMPRYCLFGDAVNTASRMESSSEPMKIQISEITRRLLPPNIYFMENRGSVSLKGKGRMKTYWLTGKEGYVQPTHEDTGFIIDQRYTPIIFGETILKRDSLAHSALSRYSSPPGSRPATGISNISKPVRIPDASKLDVNQFQKGSAVRPSLMVSAPTPAPPDIRSFAPTPAPPELNFSPTPLPQDVRLTASTTKPVIPSNFLPPIRELPSTGQVAKAVVAARTLANTRDTTVAAPLPVAVRPSVTKEDSKVAKMAASKESVVDQTLSQALVEKKRMSTSSRSVPQVHCSVQCQSSSCLLQ